MAFRKSNKVALWTGTGDDDWVTAFVTQVLPDHQYFVSALPGPAKDDTNLQSAVSEVGPVGEGDHEPGAISHVPGG